MSEISNSDLPDPVLPATMPCTPSRLAEKVSVRALFPDSKPSLARSQNLVVWERMGVALPDEDNKDHALFPEKIGERYVMLHRRPPDLWLAYSDDMRRWTDHQVIMRPRPGNWDAVKIGAAGPPIKTDQGWLLIYHGVDEQHVYRLGVALLDLAAPSVILARPKDFILEPREPWEHNGDVPHVVFSCGQVVKDGTLYAYYGGADRVMALATCPMADMIDEDSLLRLRREHPDAKVVCYVTTAHGFTQLKNTLNSPARDNSLDIFGFNQPGSTDIG